MEDLQGRVLHGQLHVGAACELVADNLPDLSHAAFFHPLPAGAGDCKGMDILTEQSGNTIFAYHSCRQSIC